MNRLDYTELMADINKEIDAPKGTFQSLFGSYEKAIEQAKYIAAVALIAADRLYSKMTKLDFEIRENDEKL
jgi:hypothetical protein